MQVLSVAVTFHAFETASLGHTSHSVPNTGDLATKIFETNSSEKPQCCRESKKSTSGKDVDSTHRHDPPKLDLHRCRWGHCNARSPVHRWLSSGSFAHQTKAYHGIPASKVHPWRLTFWTPKMGIWNMSFPFQTGGFYWFFRLWIFQGVYYPMVICFHLKYLWNTPISLPHIRHQMKDHPGGDTIHCVDM